MSRLQDRYKNEIFSKLKEELGIKNPMLVPKLEKIVISVGVGEASRDSKIVQNVADTVTLISGQKAVITKAKKSVAAFKVREGMPIGVKVTLRGRNMYNFFDKLVSIALPKVKDFRGIPANGFDGRGSYNFGLKEQLLFPEIVYDEVVRIHGMNITMVTSAKSDKEAYKLLEMLGLPFAKGRKNG